MKRIKVVIGIWIMGYIILALGCKKLPKDPVSPENEKSLFYSTIAVFEDDMGYDDFLGGTNFSYFYDGGIPSWESLPVSTGPGAETKAYFYRKLLKGTR